MDVDRPLKVLKIKKRFLKAFAEIEICFVFQTKSCLSTLFLSSLDGEK